MLATSVAFARAEVAYIVVVVSEVERLVLVNRRRTTGYRRPFSLGSWRRRRMCFMMSDRRPQSQIFLSVAQEVKPSRLLHSQSRTCLEIWR